MNKSNRAKQGWERNVEWIVQIPGLKSVQCFWKAAALLLIVFDMRIPCASEKSEYNTKSVDRCNSEVEEDNRKQNCQDLLDIRFKKDLNQPDFVVPYRREKSFRKGCNLPATVMLSGPTFLFAVKLTTLSTNASMPFAARASPRVGVISRAENWRTRSNSPVICANATHWINASGDMRVRRSRGWRCNRMLRVGASPARGSGDWMILVNTVFSAARKVPRSVRRRPQVVK